MSYWSLLISRSALVHGYRPKLGLAPANALQLMVQFSAFLAGFAPWREIPGRPIESRKGAKLAKVSIRFTRKPWANAG